MATDAFGYSVVIKMHCFVDTGSYLFVWSYREKTSAHFSRIIGLHTRNAILSDVVTRIGRSTSQNVALHLPRCVLSSPVCISPASPWSPSALQARVHLQSVVQRFCALFSQITVIFVVELTDAGLVFLVPFQYTMQKPILHLASC